MNKSKTMIDKTIDTEGCGVTSERSEFIYK